VCKILHTIFKVGTANGVWWELVCYFAWKQLSCSWINVQKMMSVCVTYLEELVVSEKSGPSNSSCTYNAPHRNLDNMQLHAFD
jgi:hypothetical protein